jgi:hypothetical protein
MPPPGSSPLDIAALIDLYQRVHGGWSEILGGLVDQPMLVVDLDTPGDVDGLVIPPLLGCVIVGISRSGAIDGSLSGVDVALVEGDQPATPWVSVADLDLALETMAVAVHGSPRASVALAQVLRLGRPDSLDHDLLLESLAYSALQGGPEFGRWLSGRPIPSPPPARDGDLIVERDDDRLALTLNRPQVRNAYNGVLRDELCAALAMVCADPSIRVVDLYGGGHDFCSGGDLSEFGTLTDPITAHLIRTSRSAARLLGIVADRVVAHLHGACVGAGVELPALAGRVVAEADTRLRLPEVAMGLIPGAGGTATLPRRIGRHRTAWLALTGQFIDATTARGWGLIDEIEAGS